jgi:hypothetical protein
MAPTTERFLTLGFAAVDWIEHFLVHGPGDVQGQPIELDDEFAAFILKAYEVDEHGSRKVRRAFLSRSKGRSKSGLAAMIACFEALGPCRFDHFAEAGEVSGWGYEYDEGEPVGAPLTYVEILNVATEESQAGNTYDAIYFMLHEDTCSPEIAAEFGRIDVGLSRINLPDKRGFIEPVTSADSSKDGGKSTFIVADETHLWRLPRLKRLHGVMTRNLLKRKLASGWMIETSTMYGEGEESVAEGTHAYAKAVAAGRKKDRTLLFDHRQASEKWDLDKRGDRLKALREAYGPASEWMNLEAIADSWDDPQVSEADFRRYWLNQPVPTDEPTPSALAGWRTRTTEANPPRPDAIGVAVSVDRAWGSIGTGGYLDGVLTLGTVDRRHGVAWLTDELLRIQREYNLPVAVDERGPAASLIETWEAAGVHVTRVGPTEYADACARLFDHIQSGSVWFIAHPDLDAAIEGARWKEIGDRRVFGRRKSVADISMLEAVTLAGFAVETASAGFNVW